MSFVTGWCQNLYLAGQAPYFREFPWPNFIVVIELSIEIPRDLRKSVCNISVTLSHVIVPICGGQMGLA